MTHTIVAKEQCLIRLKPDLQELCRNDKSWNTFYEEDKHHAEEYNRLYKEVNEAERASPQDKRLVEILETKRSLAESRMNVAYFQQLQRENELLIQTDGERAQVEAGIKSLQSKVHDWEKEVNKYLQELNRLESEKKKDEKEKISKQLLDEAMKDGSVEVVIIVCILLGQAGVGKTSLKYLLLDQRPPDLRSSTICAETPVRIQFRPVSEAMYQSLGGNWKEVKDKGALDIVARMILMADLDDTLFAEIDAAEAGINPTVVSGADAKAAKNAPRKSKGILAKITNWLKKRKKEESSSAETEASSAEKVETSASAPVADLPTSDACQRAMKKIMDELVERITKLKLETEDGQEISFANLSEEQLKLMWVYFSDCGGQPEYHELLPLFVHRISSALCVTRLTDKLDEIQEAEYFDEGKPIGAARQCQLSAKDTIQCLVNTTQSYSTQDQPPRIIMVGTHLDKLEEKIRLQSQAENTAEPSSEASVQPSIQPAAANMLESKPSLSTSSSTERMTLPPQTTEAHEEKAKMLLTAEQAVAAETVEREIREPPLTKSADMSPSQSAPTRSGQPMSCENPPLNKTSTSVAAAQDSVVAGAGEAFETLEDKNRQLLEMLEPEFSDQLVYSSNDMSQLIFPLNTLNPGEREKAIASKIRNAVENSGARKEKIPIWWYVMEQLLQQLAKELGRGMLSRAECLQMARLLNIREESFEAALVFFDELNIIMYNPKVLPDVIFINSQIPLDKLSELIRYCYFLKQATEAGDTSLKPLTKGSTWKHFRDHGVVSEEVLDCFPRHYVPGIFTREHLYKLLSSLLILAEISPPDWVHESFKTSQKYFVMLSLLSTLSEAELEKYRFSSPAASTLLVRFPSRSRRAGVFCCFVIHLIKHGGWRLMIDSNFTEPIFRNCAKLQLLTSPPCTITVIDSNSCIEVHVDITASVPRSVYAGHFPVIRQAILNGVRAACITLNYKATHPELAIYCPHTSHCSDEHTAAVKKHTATLTPDRKYWCCDLKENVSQLSGALDGRHSIWFEDDCSPAYPLSHQDVMGAGVTQKSPSKSIVIRLLAEFANSSSKLNDAHLGDILNRLWDARSRWFHIGLQLSVTIGDLEAIKKDHQESGECLREMLLMWLRKTDPSPTWKALVDALKAPSVGVLVQLTDSR